MGIPIIFLYGGTGVGKSIYALELAQSLKIHTIIGTDYIREIIRSILHPSVNSILSKSTYETGRTDNYNLSSEEVQKSEVLRGFEAQCLAISSGVEGIVKRSVHENLPLIIEGVNLIPGYFSGIERYTGNPRLIVQFMLYVEDPDIHRSRFINRQLHAPRRRTEKYVNNFREIRWIHDYLVSKAREDANIVLINNADSTREGLEKMLRHFFTK